MVLTHKCSCGPCLFFLRNIYIHSVLECKHYKALGLSSSATQAEIKSAYYELSKKHHPDKNQGSEKSAEKFRDITAAYEILGNEKLRKQYDREQLLVSNTEMELYQASCRTDYNDEFERMYYERRKHSPRRYGYGRTKYYDFDAWYKAHYSDYIKQKYYRKFLGRTIQLGVRNLSTNKALCKSHYETLGVKPDATLSEIKNAYFKLSKIYHPDKIAATDENLEKFREISNAYEILGNEQSRKLYDRGLLDITNGGLEPAQSDDPIIKFYQQKQDFSKVSKKQAEEMDAWTQTYYKEARQKIIKHNEFFKKTNKARQQTESVFSYYFVFGVMVFLMNVIISSNLENRAIEQLKRKYLHF